MGRGRLELPTARLSVVCSTTKLPSQNRRPGSRAVYCFQQYWLNLLRIMGFPPSNKEDAVEKL